MKFPSLLMPALFLSLLPAAAHAEENDSSGYVFSVTRLSTFIASQGVIDASCSHRLKGGHDAAAYQTWRENNGKVIEEVRQHAQSLPKYLAAANGTTEREEEIRFSTALGTATQVVARFVNETDKSMSKKVCAALAAALSKEHVDLEKKYVNDLATIRACAQINACPPAEAPLVKE